MGGLLLFNDDLTMSRAHSRKSCATGLMVRFFKVMIPTGHGGTGSSTGNTLRGGRFVLNFSSESGILTKNCPFARSDSNKCGDPVAAARIEMPRVRKTSATSES